MQRLAVIALFQAIVCLSLPASAGEGDEILLYGRALGKGEVAAACFVRSYDTVHLGGHPEQNVTAMTVLAYRPDWERDASVVNLEFSFRNAAEPVRLSGECGGAGRGVKSLDCGIECDGGRFAVTRTAHGTLLIDVPDGLSLCDGEDALPVGAAFGPDDRRFRVDPAKIAVCADLVFDDENRAAILKD